MPITVEQSCKNCVFASNPHVVPGMLSSSDIHYNCTKAGFPTESNPNASYDGDTSVWENDRCHFPQSQFQSRV